ncbi:hypothetical protein QBC37DRAFT_391025 [Rhypophila decipiens]|uniref:Uncharacterized protein n=1 Tax=Rhypophila decipiens TaxID=261697 RepID=A0AAN7B1Z2_9PEZI|nr:hypothetical protein QBC37DRAFT_391025 [Rhypophila decipiens]
MRILASPHMRVSKLWATVVLGGRSSVLAQETNQPTARPSSSTMDSPASRTYPTTITSSYLTTITGSAALTIDHVTVLDPWPTSPDPEIVPYTMFQTGITQRTIVPIIASPSAVSSEQPGIPAAENITTMITTTTTYLLWVIYAFDMSPYTIPACPGPEGCAYSSIKPNGRCEELGWQTRCAGQCLLKDWMWWCTKVGEDDLGSIRGRVCDDGMGVNATLEQLVEPCDHTDWRARCVRCAEDEGVTEFPDY